MKKMDMIVLLIVIGSVTATNAAQRRTVPTDRHGNHGIMPQRNFGSFRSSDAGTKQFLALVQRQVIQQEFRRRDFAPSAVEVARSKKR